MTNKFGQPLPELLSDFAEAQKWTRNEKNETGESGRDAESFIINIVIKLVQKLSLLRPIYTSGKTMRRRSVVRQN